MTDSWYNRLKEIHTLCNIAKSDTSNTLVLDYAILRIQSISTELIQEELNNKE